MVAVKIKTDFKPKKVRKPLDRAAASNLARSAAYLRTVMRNDIRGRKGASAPGTAPHTHGKRQLRKSILYAIEVPGVRAVIGPSRRLISDIAQTHEFGLTRKPKKRKITDNWKLVPGGHGPLRASTKFRQEKARVIQGKRIRVRGRRVGSPVVGRLVTEEQVARARRLATQYRAAAQNQFNVPVKYPKRPFAGPALEKSPKTILEFWRGSLKN